jgi:hypothetical protein
MSKSLTVKQLAHAVKVLVACNPRLRSTNKLQRRRDRLIDKKIIKALMR